MKTHQVTQHELQVGDIGESTWVAANAGMYEKARKLAEQGRLTEAIQAATTIRMENYGEMEGLEFRTITTTITRLQQ